MAYPQFKSYGTRATTNGGTTNSTTVPLPAGVSDGDLVLLVGLVSNNGAPAITVPSGYSFVSNTPYDNWTSCIYIASKIYRTGDVNPSVSHAAPGPASMWRAYAFSGVDQSNPVDAVAQKRESIASGSYAVPQITAATAETLQFVVAANLERVSNQTLSPVAPLTEILLDTSPNINSFLCAASANGPASAGAVTAKSFTATSGSWYGSINILIRSANPSSGGEPVSFNGTVNNQSATVGTAFNLNLSSFFAGSLTPFSYSLVAGSLTGTGLSLNSSTGVISGTPSSAATISGLQVRATDTGSNTAQTNTFSVTVQAAGIGSAVTYTVPSRTFAAAVTAGAPTTPGLSFTGLSDNMGVAYNSGTLTVRVYNQSTGALVATKTATVATGGSAVVSDVALVVGTSYDCWLQLGTGEYGAVKVTAS